MNLLKFAITAAPFLLLGCADKQALSGISAHCNKHVVMYDSFRVDLLEVDENKGEIKTLVSKSPKNDVIGQAIFNCKTGVLLFNTEEKMKSDVNNTLHGVFANGEKTVQFKYGINSMLPFGDDKYIIREQIIRWNTSDVLSKNAFPDLLTEFLDEDSITQKTVYMDDITFDVVSFNIKNKTHGTFDPTDFQDDNYITYTSSRVVLKLDPKNGNREVLINYRKPRAQGGNLVDIPQLGARLFFFKKQIVSSERRVS